MLQKVLEIKTLDKNAFYNHIKTDRMELFVGLWQRSRPEMPHNFIIWLVLLLLFLLFVTSFTSAAELLWISQRTLIFGCVLPHCGFLKTP